MTVLTDESFALGYDVVIGGVRYRQTWVGAADVPVDHVRALAFTSDDELLLVHGDLGFQLPGGGVEGQESVDEALRRELSEEAAATITAARRIGAVQIDVLDDGRREFHDFYCCRISMDDVWSPTDEISRRVTVPPHRFLDTLHWGDDPRAAFLLEKAMQTVETL